MAKGVRRGCERCVGVWVCGGARGVWGCERGVGVCGVCGVCGGV